MEKKDRAPQPQPSASAMLFFHFPIGLKPTLQESERHGATLSSGWSAPLNKCNRKTNDCLCMGFSITFGTRASATINSISNVPRPQSFPVVKTLHGIEVLDGLPRASNRRRQMPSGVSLCRKLTVGEALASIEIISSSPLITKERRSDEHKRRKGAQGLTV